MIELRSQFMYAEESRVEGSITTRWTIRSKYDNGRLGTVRWYGPWRQYCFFPTEGTVFNDGCLGAIREFLADANREHKAAKDRSQ